MNRLRTILVALILSATVAGAIDWRPVRASVGTSSAVEIGNKAGRTSFCFKDTDSVNPIYCGPTSGVTSSTGQPISAGDRYCVDGPAAGLSVYCIATGGTVAVGGRENVQ